MARRDDQSPSAVDRTNDLVNKAQQIKALIDKAQMAYKAAQAVAAAIATSEIWVPLAIGGAIILIVLFILLKPGGTGLASSQNSSTTPPGGGGSSGGGSNAFSASCPITDGKIVTSSFQVDPINGHCGSRYGACDPNSRRAKSIDVSAIGEDVILPTVEGSQINWKYLSSYSLQDNDCGDKNFFLPAGKKCGVGYVFSSDTDWWLQLLHMQPSTLTAGNIYQSGTIVGRVTGGHVHVTIGKGIKDPTGMDPLDPGWLAADRDVGMCVVKSNTASNTCTQQYEGTGPCSVDNLMPYFGNDSKKALLASLTCQAESSSYLFALNKDCSTNDYSVGLFQINAVAHCVDTNGNKAFGNLSCNNLLSASIRDACVADWQTASGNINMAKDISNNGASWTAWGTWLNASQNGPAVKDILNKCGISY